MNFLKNLFSEKNPSEVEILNSGLSFAMEFGQNWLQPIQERLAKKFSFLSSLELDNYNATCKNVMDNGQEFVYKILENLVENNQTIKEMELKQKFADFILSEYNWIDKKNISKLFSQICYYAYKDGLDSAIIS